MTSAPEALSNGIRSGDARTPAVDHSQITLPSSTSSSSVSPSCEPMDVTSFPITASMAPPVTASPGGARSAIFGRLEGTNGASAPALASAAGTPQPKVVQTAFIHKLYNMLEDQSIQHLISWSTTNESFVMSPSPEFSKVLASYFKHTNISSFVRQLNMYGFHKVSDVFHNGAPDTPLWEFKHGNGSFKRGDLTGLREIKRRASRHALIHRDSFATPKVQPGPFGTATEAISDPLEARLAGLEHSLYDLHSRLARSEDSCAFLSSRCQSLADGLSRCHQWNQDLSDCISALVPDPDNPIHREASNMGRSIERQKNVLKGGEEPPDPFFAPRFSYFNNLPSEPVAPLSPHYIPPDDQRRASLTEQPRQSLFKAPALPSVSISPRRYGSINGNGTYTSQPVRAQAPPPPRPPPLAPSALQPPFASAGSIPALLARRHTSADIRLHGWQVQTHSPLASGQSSVQWPSSPHRTPNNGDQAIRDALAQYEIGRAPRSRQATPPPASDATTSVSVESGWTAPGPRFPFKGIDTSAPPTRRSSLASNVHALLNPAETAERSDEADSMADDRKRKRM